MKLEHEGTFRGPVLEHGVNASKNGFPTWIARLACHSMYVGESEEEIERWKAAGYEVDEEGWADVESEGWQITTFLTLMNAEKTFLNYDQVIAATGWDGADFAALSAMDLNDHAIQFRTGEETYNDQTQLRVTWIDEVGAPLQRELSALDEGGLKDLTSQFKGLMKSKAKAAPASAKKAPTETKKKAAAPKPKAKAAPPAAAKPKVEDPPAETPDPTAIAPMDISKAWDYVQKHTDLDDQALTEAWLAACEAVAPDKDQEEITDEEWAQVAATILAG